jgi:hypothetical protein
MTFPAFDQLPHWVRVRKQLGLLVREEGKVQT